MTAFVGCMSLVPLATGSASEARWRALCDSAARALSRDPGHTIERHESGAFFIAFFNNGAWHGSTQTSNERGTTWVAGDPLVPDEDSVTNTPAKSRGSIHESLTTGNLQSLRRTVGCFAAVTWDSINGTMRLAVDKLALRPIYFSEQRDPINGDRVLFATSLRVLRVALDGTPAVDEQGLAEFLFVGQPIATRTVLSDVRVLAPGEVVTVRSGRIESVRYFNLSETRPRALDEASASEALHKSFLTAVRRRSRRESEDAFLSGGMDSRSVVAGLIDIGRRVHTFGSAFPGSADDVISRMVAEAFGTKHIAEQRNPADRLRTNMDPFALYARRHFPPDGPHTGRIMWSGDGGSVVMGHVYLDEAGLACAAGPVDRAEIERLFPRFRTNVTRHLSKSVCRRLRTLALEGVRAEFRQLDGATPDRRLFLYYVGTDQMRHLYNHFEAIDLSGIEFEMPFFDADFVELVTSLPIALFLRHRLYNAWISRFRAPAAALPWQVYPGHMPGPHPMPDNLTHQWSQDWYRTAECRQIVSRIATQLLAASHHGSSSQYMNYHWLLFCKILNAFGITRYNYEIDQARRIREAVEGITGNDYTGN